MNKLLLFVLMLLPMVASADISGKCGDNVYYTYNSADHTLTIYGEGAIWSNFVGDDEHPWGGLSSIDMNDIQSVIIESGVTSIRRWAFSGFRGMTSVTIPNSVTSIYDCAFYGCSGLTSVTIPNSVLLIDEDVFSGCIGMTSIKVESGNSKYDSRNNCNAIIETSSNTLIAGCKNTTIPNSVTSIGNAAFAGCSGMTSVTIPNSVTSIGSSAFYNCTGLTKIISEIENPLIVDDVFSCNDKDIYASATLVVPPGKKSAYQNTNGWKQFTNIVEAELIGYEFEYGGIRYKIVENNTVSVTSGETKYSGPVVIPNQVTYLGTTYSVISIERGAFFDCSSLTSITIPNSVTSIGENAFYHCNSLTSIIIPNSVMSIGEYAFQGCSSLTSVTIADGVTSIGGYAFLGCSRLTSVTIPNSVTSIGVWAFDSCKSLTSITIPNSVTTIGWGAFARCSSLSSITVEDGNMYYDSRNNCNAIIDSNNQLVVGCKYSIIPNSVANIGRYAFYGCSGLTSITIPNSVTSIGSNAFQNCSSLTTIISEIENPFTIDNSVFDFPSNAQLIVPKGTEEKYKVTEGWYKLYNIDKCGDKVYYSYNSTTHTLTISGNGAMNSGFGGAEPDNRPWLSYLTDIQKIVIESGVTTIDWYAFSGCINLTSVTIPSSVTHIDDGAFNGCRGLTTVNIPYGVTSIGNDDWGGAFQGCTGLTSITIPNSVTTIGYKSFAGCTNLISITIPNSVTSIDSDAFRDCSSLESMVVESGNTKYDSRNNCNAIIETTSNTLVAGCKNTIIPNSVTAIGNFAFYGCSGLTSVTIPNSVTSIGNYAFSGCSGLTSVIVGNGMTNIGSNSYGWSSTNLKEMILSQTAYENGIPASVTKFTTYSKNPMRVVVTSKGTTSATMKIYPIDESGNTNEDNSYTVTMLGLTPGQYITWKLDDENYGIISEKTNALALEVQPAKPTSKIKARLLATVNELDDDLHFGFEWLRYDAPSNMTPNKVSAPLYEGQIVGSLNNLNPDVYYKYRPYYKSEDGSMFYGEWESFITGDADVFFEPETHTKDVVEVTSVSAQLAGVWIEGTEDIEEKGFEYWTVSGGNTRAVGKDVKTVVVSGNKMSVTIEGLIPGKNYGYRSYIKTVSGKTYGEEKTFKTVLAGDVNGDGSVNEADVEAVADYIMGNAPTGFNKDTADVNNDNKVNAADIVLINKMIMK